MKKSLPKTGQPSIRLLGEVELADLCNRICVAIQTTDDNSIEEADYMLDCNDCIKIVREQFAAEIHIHKASAQEEPVAWICTEWSGTGIPELSFNGPPQELSVRDEVTRPVWTPLYATPRPKRQPLTDEQVWGSDEIMTVNADVKLLMSELMMIIRAVEAAHGIR